MEDKVFTINGITFKQTKYSKYYVKKGEKFIQVKKAVYLEEMDLASKIEKRMTPDVMENMTDHSATVIFLGTIKKPVARKLTRRYAKGVKGVHTWFAEVAAISGMTHRQIKRHLKAI